MIEYTAACRWDGMAHCRMHSPTPAAPRTLPSPAALNREPCFAARACDTCCKPTRQEMLAHQPSTVTKQAVSVWAAAGCRCPRGRCCLTASPLAPSCPACPHQPQCSPNCERQHQRRSWCCTAELPGWAPPSCCPPCLLLLLALRWLLAASAGWAVAAAQAERDPWPVRSGQCMQPRQKQQCLGQGKRG